MNIIDKIENVEKGLAMTLLKLFNLIGQLPYKKQRKRTWVAILFVRFVFHDYS